jgi:hypothetical protein
MVNSPYWMTAKKWAWPQLILIAGIQLMCLAEHTEEIGGVFLSYNNRKLKITSLE